MSKTVRLVSENWGKIVPGSVSDYIKVGGFEALKKAIEITPTGVIEELKKSNLMGRGGAAYPTGIKWEQIYVIDKYPKYIVCNADEGEPGTFKDRLLLTEDPLKVIEGIIIAGYTIKAEKAYIYIRGEYPRAQEIMKNAIKNAKEAGFLGDNILGTGFSFDIEVVSGAGAYVCGENSALVESAEGKAGRPRIKPPYIKNVGLFNMPTLVNNVETFAYVPVIIAKGAEEFTKYGTEKSPGTKLISICGNVVNRGVYEIPFGLTMREIIYDIAGGIEGGRELKFVQIGGSSCECMPKELIDTPFCYKELKSKGFSVGSGAILVVDDRTCVVDFIKCITEFFVHESCGKCTPCREGNTQVYNIIKRFTEGNGTEKDIKLLERLSTTMKYASFCGLGQTATNALSSCLKYFREEFIEHTKGICRTNVCKF